VLAVPAAVIARHHSYRPPIQRRVGTAAPEAGRSPRRYARRRPPFRSRRRPVGRARLGLDRGDGRGIRHEGLRGGIVTRELALQPERRPMPVKPPKAPLARTRSGAEENSVHLRGQRVEGTPEPPPTPVRWQSATALSL
jgi:hypothetical protein